MSLLDRLRGRGADVAARGAEPVLVVGLGNPGQRYADSRHNAGAVVAAELARRWELPRPKQRFRGRITDGRTEPGGPRVAVLVPETYMNESGDSVGPARGSLRIGPERVVVLHDEIDLPFGRIEARRGGGLAGHNGLKSVARGLGGPDFWRVRVGVGRPDTTDSEVVSAHVLGRFSEPQEDVRALIESAAEEAERLVRRIGQEEPEQ